MKLAKEDIKIIGKKYDNPSIFIVELPAKYIEGIDDYKEIDFKMLDEQEITPEIEDLVKKSKEMSLKEHICLSNMY